VANITIFPVIFLSGVFFPLTVRVEMTAAGGERHRVAPASA
jgi:hypothetical protein